MSGEAVEVIEVAAWEAGTHEASGKVVVVFRYTDRAPIAIGCDPAIALEIGEALIKLGTAGKPSLN